MAKYIIISLLTLQQGFSQDCFGGEFRTSESYTYGRYEVKMKPAYGDGYVSSFFTYHDFWETFYGNWATFINEIDIEFTGNLNNSIQFTTHHPGSWSLTEIIPIPFDPYNDFHSYAFEWTPTYVKWFIDGIEIYTQNENEVIDLIYPQKIMMNIWASIHNNWVGEWNNETLPVYSYYDQVSYYSFTENQGNYGTNNDFTLQWTDDFDTFDGSRWIEATHGFDGNHCQFSPVNVFIHNGKLILQATSIEYILGDVNNDLTLNVIDVISIINIILSFDDPINVSDYNQDNYINILDVIFIIDVILEI